MPKEQLPMLHFVTFTSILIPMVKKKRRPQFCHMIVLSSPFGVHPCFMVKSVLLIALVVCVVYFLFVFHLCAMSIVARFSQFSILGCPFGLSSVYCLIVEAYMYCVLKLKSNLCKY